MKKVLVTDSLFIFDEHVAKLQEHGFEVERLDNPKASEEELMAAIKDKDAYIIGGIETVTEAVIQAGENLKVITFTGADPFSFIPGHQVATDKGIAITGTPGANAYAVAEYTVSNIMAMTRNLAELTRTGERTFQTTKSLKDLSVGVIGLGAIGKEVVQMCRGLGVKKVLYTGPNDKKVDYAEYVSMDTLLESSDVVTLHAPSTAGLGFIGKTELAKVKDGSLIIDCGFIGGLDQEAIYEEVNTGRLRGFQDYPAAEKFNDLPKEIWMNSNDHTAFNTHEANRTASDMAVTSLINIFETGADQYKFN